MPQTINTNVTSLTAQRNLNASQSSLTTSMQRLSSGLRVNSAKDDAAGLAIAERMNTQVRGLSVAARNANDGISLAQVAEGALGKVGDMLQRMRELAVQSSNATNSDDDRLALQAEVTQLRDEINRVAQQTGFNGQKLLDGTFSAASFQVGANSGETITVAALTDATADGLSQVTYGDGGNASIDAASVTTLDEIAANTLSITVGADTYDLPEIPEARTGAERMGQVVEAINRRTADTGVSAFLSQNDDGTYALEVRSSRIDETTGDAMAVTATGFSLATTGIDAADMTTTSTDASGIADLSVETAEDSWLAINQIDDALSQINSARATLGAVQSRFENAVSNIQIQSENTSAARGRIMDADFAAETANLSRAQILQQAGNAMVAQANQLPQQVLKLLQG
ncbi:flagellin [Eleftheria terrae]|uniref:flagellin n=1 Tax=Eleftheria terrae TaxID=1597781 RepID=UPI00263A9DB8|nr:flagellin [Eleftheria terrae]WKB54486.1 flagellin [Eleftheria terrae]